MDDPDNYPYDNVEFPVRRTTSPTTTQSGSVGSSSMSTGIIGSSVSASPRIIVHPTLQEKQTPSLAPVIEMDGAEGEGEERSHGSTTTSSVAKSGLLYTQTTNLSNRHTSQSPTMSQQSSGTTFGGKQTGAATMTTAGHGIPPTPQITIKQDPEKTEKVVVITKQPELVTWPFEPSDLDTVSQGVLENAYRDQATYDKLYAAMIEQGHALQKPLYDTKPKVRDRLSYEQLLQGMLFDGERLLLSGHWIYFTRLDYLDESGKEETHPSLGSGRACLTNRRLLILVADNNTEATLVPYGGSKSMPGSYELSLTQKDDIFYQSLPLSLFSSVEMDVSVGTKSRTKIQAQRPCLASICCCCFGPSSTTWKSTLPQTHNFNRRTISLGATLPPWKKPGVLIIHLHPDLPLTLARDFVAFIQSNAQQLH